jgi:hypothetical protein
MNRADVRMTQRRNGPRLVFEALAETAARRLDGDVAPEPDVAGLYTSPMPPAPIAATIS